MVEAIYKEVGEAIQRARRTRLSQTKLGKLLNPKVTRACIANIENGTQRLLVHRLLQIAEALKIPVIDLLPSNTVKEPLPSENLVRELREQLKIPDKRIKALTSKIRRRTHQ